MKTIIESRISLPGEGGRELSTVWEPLRFRRPKLIVGVSLTFVGEPGCHEGAKIIPAVIDTGFNGILEIDERHLTMTNNSDLKNPIIHKDWLDRIKIKVKDSSYNKFKDKGNVERKFYDAQIVIWMHRFPYEHPVTHGWLVPHPLHETKRMRVVVPQSEEYWPPFPLLGLQAFTMNELSLNVDAKKSTFSIKS